MRESVCVPTRLRSEARTDKIERLLGNPHGTVPPRDEAIVRRHGKGDGQSKRGYGISM